MVVRCVALIRRLQATVLADSFSEFHMFSDETNLHIYFNNHFHFSFWTFTGTTFNAGILALGSMGTALIKALKLGSLK